MDYKLTQTELTILWNAHRTTRDGRLRDRIKVVYDLGLGLKPEDIAKFLMMDEKTVRHYFKVYKEKGIEGLLRTAYIGSKSALDANQKKELAKYLEANLFQTTKEIAEHVYKTYKIRYSRSGMTKLLHELGFSYKKPKHIPGKANRQAQEEFVKKYRELRETADENDPIVFMDGCHPMYNSVASYGWIRKGMDKELKANTGRQRLNINGVIDIKSMRWTVDLPPTVNAQSTIALFRKLERRYPLAHKIYVIADNARYYRSALVANYLAGSKIELIFLPPYSPNLNLIERFWKFFKKKVLNNRYYETFSAFVYACKCFFQQRKRHEEELRTLLTENFLLYST